MEAPLTAVLECSGATILREIQMSEIPSDLLFAESHEWVRFDGHGTAVIGISDHAQAALGDMVYIELPEPGMSYDQGDACAVVESVKAASDIYAPVSGEIIEANGALEDTPETVNDDPYGEGWLFKIQLSNNSDLDNLLSPEAYAAAQAEEG
jgi:glycine cleavage system H protein